MVEPKHLFKNHSVKSKNCSFSMGVSSVHAQCTLGARKSHPHFGAATC